MRNYLPFGRRSIATLRRDDNSSRYKPIRSATKLSDLTTGGFIRAYLQDAIVFYDITSLPDDLSSFPQPIRMRFGISGKPYYTESFYDVKVYENGICPTQPVWKWSHPYRIYPGQNLTGRMHTEDIIDNNGERWPVAGLMFSGIRVEDGRPAMLYGVDTAAIETDPNIANATDQLLADTQFDCPFDSAIDLYSVTVHAFEAGVSQYWPRPIQIWDHNDRAFWQDFDVGGYLQPPSTTIPLGDDFILEAGETISFELQPTGLDHLDAGGKEIPDLDVHILIRGQMEVEDGR